ncbi:YqaJ viral recombinase family protein [Allokutzneria sp. A3M-2-11 16]|uniref:YqaJ viral recombinase family nuclease n=1 Tax=Allokutzneria sp. A3M-2-11 16 TaxID=2962043 RepID=UPI0020B8A73D|nr:YqaJ viral recombinase family protein [Allokutzneria sp. A3M-2-11 16]MCP3799769.1 YqaJ viral recombinase family protein [Allokutzneria sp. A3M-2-11 16]
MSTAAVRLGTWAPGSAEWFSARASGLGGSEIAAVLGLSPWESRFSLWHKKKGLAAPEPDNDAMRRGRLFEAVVAEWFAAEHPEYRVRRTGTWASRHRPWQVATPDRLLSAVAGRALLEIKTATDTDKWGEPGTDEIPVHYRAQVMWQLDTLGLRRAHVAVLTSGLNFREYVVDWNLAEVEVLRTAGREFLDTIERDERPDIDEHGATYRVVRELHPDIDDVEVEIEPALAERYRRTVAEHKSAEAAKQQATAEVLDALGSGRRAVVAGESIAIRVPGRGDAPPSLRPSPIRSTPQKVSAAA